MSLTLEKLHMLRGKSFLGLYSQHKDKWREMVANAKNYTKTYIGKDGEKIRPGDVAEILQNAVKVDPDFEDHMNEKGLQQKYWVVYFSDYVLEQVYPSKEIT